MNIIQKIREHFDVIIFIYVLYLVIGSYLCEKELIELGFIFIFSIFYIYIKINNKKIKV